MKYRYDFNKMYGALTRWQALSEAWGYSVEMSEVLPFSPVADILVGLEEADTKARKQTR